MIHEMLNLVHVHKQLIRSEVPYCSVFFSGWRNFLSWCFDVTHTHSLKLLSSVRETSHQTDSTVQSTSVILSILMRTLRSKLTVRHLCLLGCAVHFGFLTYISVCPSLPKIKIRLNQTNIHKVWLRSKWKLEVVVGGGGWSYTLNLLRGRRLDLVN